jgi:hypothetical protein
MPQPATLVAVLHRHAMREQSVHPPVLGEYVGALRSPYGRRHVGDRLRRQVRVEQADRRSNRSSRTTSRYDARSVAGSPGAMSGP